MNFKGFWIHLPECTCYIQGRICAKEIKSPEQVSRTHHIVFPNPNTSAKPKPCSRILRTVLGTFVEASGKLVQPYS